MSWKKFNKEKKGYAWVELISIIFGNLYSIIRNPSFIIFSIIAISLGTLGIWIDFYPNGFTEGKSFTESMNKLSVFTFCVATLGGLGTDYVFEEKYLDDQLNNEQQLLSRHLAFLMWFLCLVLSFFALRSDWAVIPALSATLILWMCVNINTKKFQRINEDAKRNLVPDYSNNLSPDEFEGDGL